MTNDPKSGIKNACAVFAVTLVVLLSVALAARGASRAAFRTVHEGRLVSYLYDCFLFEIGATVEAVTCPNGWVPAQDRPLFEGATYRVLERRTVLGSPMIVEEVCK